MQVNRFFATNGTGYWTRVSKKVLVKDIVLIPSKFCPELRVYFDKGTWNTQRNGLIYSDPLFLSDLRRFLQANSKLPAECEYSEQGMQGDDYVSFDVSQDCNI